jgi:hypothetical protein
MRVALLAILTLSFSPLLRGQAAMQPHDTVEELRQRVEKIVDEARVPAITIALVNRDAPYWVAGWA